MQSRSERVTLAAQSGHILPVRYCRRSKRCADRKRVEVALDSLSDDPHGLSTWSPLQAHQHGAHRSRSVFRRRVISPSLAIQTVTSQMAVPTLISTRRGHRWARRGNRRDNA